MDEHTHPPSVASGLDDPQLNPAPGDAPRSLNSGGPGPGPTTHVPFVDPYANTQVRLQRPIVSPDPFTDPELNPAPDPLPIGFEIPPPDPFFPETVAGDGVIECPVDQLFPVRGRFLYDNPAMGLRPIKYGQVLVWSVTGPGNLFPLAAPVGVGRTNARGEYDFQACHDPMSGDFGDNANIVIMVALQSSALRVGRYLWVPIPDGLEIRTFFVLFIYSGYTDTFVHPPRGGLLDAGDWSLPFLDTDDDTPQANWGNANLIYSQDSGLMNSWAFATADLGYTPDTLELHYMAPYLAPIGEPFPHYHVEGMPCPFMGNWWPTNPCRDVFSIVHRQMHIEAPESAQSPDILAHLYGHYLMQDVYLRNDYAGPTGVHYPESTTTTCYPGQGVGCYGDHPGFRRIYNSIFDDPFVAVPEDRRYWLFNPQRFDTAFDEGVAWAEGFADFYATWVNAPADGLFTFEGRYQHNLEGIGPIDPDVESIEWNVAAALLDMVDNANDGWDQHSVTVQDVWAAVQSGYQGSIDDFWTAFRNLYLATQPQLVHAAKSGLFQNHMDRNQAPFTLNLRLEPESPNGWYSGQVEIVVTVVEPDQEDNGFLDVNFAVWRDGGWTTLQQFTGQISGEFRVNWDTTQVPDGADRQVRVIGNDHLEDSPPATLLVDIDNSATTVALLAPSQAGWITDSTPTFQWMYSGTGAPIDYADLYVYNRDSNSQCTTIYRQQNLIDGTEWTWTAEIDDGKYCWRVRAVDEAGNEAWSETWHLNMDADNPDVTLQSPPDLYVGNWNRPLFEWFASDTGSGIQEIRLTVCDVPPVAGCRPTVVLGPSVTSYQWGTRTEAPLADGGWQWTVTVRDVAGHEASAARTLTNTVPTPPGSLVPTDIGWCSVTLQWSPVPDPSWSYYKTYYKPPNPAPWTYYQSTTATSETVKGLQAAVQYGFHVTSVDDVTAESSPSSDVFATTAARPPGYQPTPSQIHVWDVGVDYASLWWDRYLECDFREYRLYRDANLIYTTTTETSYFDGTLQPCSDYTYELRVATVNGDEAISNPLYITTLCFASFRGYVTTDTGLPVEGAQIEVRRSDTGELLWTVWTDVYGYYRTKNLDTQLLYDLTGRYTPWCWVETRTNLRPSVQDFTISWMCT